MRGIEKHSLTTIEKQKFSGAFSTVIAIRDDSIYPHLLAVVGYFCMDCLAKLLIFKPEACIR
jgi:hypothetical protein